MAHPKKVALVFAAMLGGAHLLWSILIALGWAQPLVNFSMWAHMVKMSVVVQPFDITAAVTVIIIASAIGYVVGYIGAIVWNKVRRA